MKTVKAVIHASVFTEIRSQTSYRAAKALFAAPVYEPRRPLACLKTIVLGIITNLVVWDILEIRELTVLKIIGINRPLGKPNTPYREASVLVLARLSPPLRKNIGLMKAWTSDQRASNKRRGRGAAVRVPDLKSGGPGFKPPPRPRL